MEYMKKDTITVFTDGSSRGNPGQGGWAALLITNYELGIKNENAKVFELGGREEHTTNNRMEMTAAQEALAYIESHKLEGRVEIHTDSAYLLQGVTGWMYGWEKNGWKTKDGNDVSNQDLWKEIGALVFRLKQKHEIDWVKVSGHSGLRGNERVDEICTNEADHVQQEFFEGTLSDYEKMIGGSVFDVDEEVKSRKVESRKSSSKAAFSYVSMIGGLIQLHKTWAECEARVKGKKGAKYQKVFSAQEEKELIEEWTRINLGTTPS